MMIIRRYAQLIAVAILVTATTVGNFAQQETVAEVRTKAEQGDADAQYNLGAAYALGQGVPQDYAEAVRWFRLAADQGNDSAQASLGFAYANGLGDWLIGEGVAQDEAEAARWYRLAADQGNTGAQYGLGVMYQYGRGVTQDHVAAYMWLDLAASRLTGAERDRAVDGRDSVGIQLTASQRAEAQRLAREWAAAHPREP